MSVAVHRAAWLVVVIALLGPAAHAQSPSPLERLHVAAEQLDFEAVVGACQEALASGTLTHAQLAHVYRQLAMAESFLGNVADARTAYERMLALEPDSRPDESVPPRLQAAYVEALRVRERLRVEASTTIAGHVLRVHVTDGVGAIARVSFVYDLGDGTSERTEEQDAAAEVELRIDERVSGQIRYRVHLLDAFGNVWFELGTSEAPRTGYVAPSPIRAAPVRPTRRLVRSPWLWSSVGVVVLGIGIGVGVSRDRTVRAVTGVTF